MPQSPIKRFVVKQNGDDAAIAWNTDGEVPDLLGVAVERTYFDGPEAGVPKLIHNYVGFEDEAGQGVRSKPTSEWPLQRYVWTDHGATPGREVRYRLIPVFDRDHDRKPDALDYSLAVSTGRIKLEYEAGPDMKAFFNRGTLMSQFVSRYLPADFNQTDLLKLKEALKKRSLWSAVENSLGQDIGKLRSWLMGDLGHALFGLLEQVRERGWHAYAVLYELADDDLVAALGRLGDHAHVVLANGSVGKKGEDGNATAAAALEAAGVDLVRRMCAPNFLGHNKFLVVVDDQDRAKSVWTGSLNWAATGLCTQLNNGVFVENGELAGRFRDQYDRLVSFGDGAGAGNASLRKLNHADLAKPDVASTQASWRARTIFTRVGDRADLTELDALIDGAQQAILFLMFQPGGAGAYASIVDKLKTVGGSVFISGVVSTMPSSDTEDVQVFRGLKDDSGRFAVLEPEGVKKGLAWWAKEVTRKEFLIRHLPGGVTTKGIGHAIVHSKCFVIDPWGPDPVVVTGSHNFSKSASEENDENLLVIRGSPELAERYAVHIASVYDHYSYRVRLASRQNAGLATYGGLERDGSWQRRRAGDKSTLDFWGV